VHVSWPHRVRLSSVVAGREYGLADCQRAPQLPCLLGSCAPAFLRVPAQLRRAPPFAELIVQEGPDGFLSAKPSELVPAPPPRRLQAPGAGLDVLIVQVVPHLAPHVFTVCAMLPMTGLLCNRPHELAPG
jgi:hypothetical protein